MPHPVANFLACWTGRFAKYLSGDIVGRLLLCVLCRPFGDTVIIELLREPMFYNGLNLRSTVDLKKIFLQSLYEWLYTMSFMFSSVVTFLNFTI